MQCELARELIGAYQDGELSVDERRAVVAHLDTCKACGDMLADYGRIGRLVQQQGRIPAPPALAGKIRTALDRVAIEEPKTAAPVSPGIHKTFAVRHIRGALRAATALAAACLISVLATWWIVDTGSQRGSIERDILNAHIRSLLQDSPVQVATSDQHTVRPWFAGRTDFAPTVKDLASQGFPLVGGRLDYVADRRVSALVYKRRLHLVNVFLWPAPTGADSAPRMATRNGYNLLTWSQNGVAYWCVSDLNAEELQVLQRLL